MDFLYIFMYIYVSIYICTYMFIYVCGVFNGKSAQRHQDLYESDENLGYFSIPALFAAPHRWNRVQEFHCVAGGPENQTLQDRGQRESEEHPQWGLAQILWEGISLLHTLLPVTFHK